MYCGVKTMPKGMLLNILAQVLGLGGTYMLFTLYQQNDRKKLLLRKLCADALWGIHYVCLGAAAGAIPNIMGVFRETVFMNSDKKWAKSPLWPAVFIIISWILAIISWKSELSLLPMCASTLVTISLWVKSPRLTRILTVPVCTAFIIYDVFVGSYAGIINESISLVSIIIAFFRNDYKGHSASAE